MNIVRIGVVIFLAVLLILCMFVSLGWRMCLDTPILHYIIYLMDQYDFIPYQDIYDNNVPGTYLFHMIMIRLIGYGNFAFRCFDMMSLLLLFLISWLLMKRFGHVPALLGLILFGLRYLNQGPNMSMQRDFICILPIALAFLYVTLPYSRKHHCLSGILVGALAAVSASLKPSFCIGAIPLILFLHWENIGSEQLWKRHSWVKLLQLLVFTGIGFIPVLIVPIAWVYMKGGFPDFIMTMKSYIPLYTNMNGYLRTMDGTERTLYFLKQFFTLGIRNTYSLRLLIPAIIGIFMVFKLFPESNSKKKFVVLLASLCFMYSLYPLSQGKFWTTHYLPMQYFLVLCASLTFVKPAGQRQWTYLKSIALIIMIGFIVTTVRPTRDFSRRMRGAAATPPNWGRVDEIAHYLKSNMEPGDTVQPLDFIRGAVHAMLLAKAKIATPFIYDLQFYHHISNPYIQNIRKQFITQMKEVKPRFVIRVTDKPWPSGRDTTRDFPALDEFLQNRYHTAHEGDGYKIFEINR